jgi:hypothetical protein
VGRAGMGFSIVSIAVFSMSRQPTGSRQHTYDREVTDSEGRPTVVHEEVC